MKIPNQESSLLHWKRDRPQNKGRTESKNSMATTFEELRVNPIVTSIALGGLSLVLIFILVNKMIPKKMECGRLPNVPEIPGLPLLGNLLQLREKKPHKTFTKWAETYGPIFSIKTGATTIIILNTTEVAKEAMVTRFSSISTRKLTDGLKILTHDKCMVATSDYDDFHKMTKRYIMTSILGSNAQRRHRMHRGTLIEDMSNQLHAHVKNSPHQPLNYRKLVQSVLLGLGLKQAFGADVESIYVEELGTLSKEEIFDILVYDIILGAIDVDWREFFPYLKWIPNKRLETRIQKKHFRRMAVMNALIKEQKKRIASGKAVDCYIDFLLSEAKALTDEQIAMLLWEIIIESSDTSFVIGEWAIYELAKDQTRQERLYTSIQDLCGTDKIREDQLSQLPLLNGVFHETLRKYSPLPLIPLRYAHEDTQIGGFFVPAGSKIAVNLYGCNMDKTLWESPIEWKPERFLDKKFDPSDLYKTMGFGAGKRVCAGSPQAISIGSTVIGRLVQEFKWNLIDVKNENADTLGLTTHKRQPLHVIIEPRT